MESWSKNVPLLIATNEYSSIEHLAITERIDIYGLNSLLSYTTQLRRLPSDSLSRSADKPTTSSPHLLNHLTYLSLNVKYIKFDKFEQIIIDLFSSIQVLRVTTNNVMEVDANK